MRASRVTLVTTTYYIVRSFYFFDVSGLSGTATAVSLNIRGITNAESDVSAQLGTQADPLTTADYDSFTGSSYGNTSWSTGWNSITYNATGISDVNGQIGSGTHKVCCREYTHDYSDSTPTGQNRNGCYFADSGGTDNDPYLDITLITASQMIIIE
jgi:hypothetical protein